MDKKNESVKFNISMKKSIFDMVEEYADSMGINRSAFISFCCTSYIQQQKALKTLEMLEKLNSQELSESEKNNKSVSDIDIENLRKVLGQ